MSRKQNLSFKSMYCFSHNRSWFFPEALRGVFQLQSMPVDRVITAWGLVRWLEYDISSLHKLL